MLTSRWVRKQRYDWAFFKTCPSSPCPKGIQPPRTVPPIKEQVLEYASPWWLFTFKLSKHSVADSYKRQQKQDLYA